MNWTNRLLSETYRLVDIFSLIHELGWIYRLELMSTGGISGRIYYVSTRARFNPPCSIPILKVELSHCIST